MRDWVREYILIFNCLYWIVNGLGILEIVFRLVNVDGLELYESVIKI